MNPDQIQISDVNVRSYTPLPSPNEVVRFSREVPGDTKQFILSSRQIIDDIIRGEDKRKLLIVGPCSIHDSHAAYDYALKLVKLKHKVQEHIFIVMRTYFEKPRTITGWKGLLYDPKKDGSNDIIAGIHAVRSLLIKINRLGLPCACEFLDPNMPQYYSDLITWGAIGARTTESQVHRQLASGLSCPIGFKNSTSGSVKYPINSIRSCAQPHTFPGIDMNGRACIINTKGNPSCHLILRGSQQGANYRDLDTVYQKLKADVHEHHGIIIDCSHGNSGKSYEEQEKVWVEIINEQLHHPGLVGLMVESFLLPGRVDLKDSYRMRHYGRSVTDECISWQMTLTYVMQMYNTIAIN